MTDATDRWLQDDLDLFNKFLVDIIDDITPGPCSICLSCKEVHKLGAMKYHVSVCRPYLLNRSVASAHTQLREAVRHSLQTFADGGTQLLSPDTGDDRHTVPVRDDSTWNISRV